jgi:hypothetical protein
MNVRHRRYLASRVHGAAVVELAVLMVFIVPMIAFTMFMFDALYHHLEAQEAVYATTWDLSTRGWGRCKQAGSNSFCTAGNCSQTEGQRHLDQVGGYNRIEYADHTSAYIDTADIVAGPAMSNANHMLHHFQAFGHACWCQGENGGKCNDPQTDYSDQTTSTQVRCKFDRGTDAEKYSLDLTGGVGDYRDNWSEGAVTECWGKEWLYNYIVGQHFLRKATNFGKAGDEFNKKRHNETDIHTIAPNPNLDILLRDRAGLLVDTWAISEGLNNGGGPPNNTDNVDVGSTGPDECFYNRTNTVFEHKAWYVLPIAANLSYLSQCQSKQLANVPAVPYAGMTVLGVAPNILGLWMNTQHQNWNETNKTKYKATNKDGFISFIGTRYYTTPLVDDDQQAFDARGKYYLAATSPQAR